jgi:OOP family OmpA-OmpF porin
MSSFTRYTSIIRYTKHLPLSLAIAIASANATAEDKGAFYINPAVGYQMFDNDRNADSAITGIIGGEYVLTPEWGVEATYMMSSPDGKDGNTDADLTQARLGVLYYLNDFGMNGEWSPFLGIGVSAAEFEYSNVEHDETQWHFGGGTRYVFNKDWSARLDARAIASADEETLDGLFSIGVSYAFGASAPRAKAQPIQAQPKPAPQQQVIAAKPVAVVAIVKDSDKDGIQDTQDQCPNTPQGVKVSNIGCPLDGDKDGVLDYKDMCPTTEAGVKVDETGCKVLTEKSVSIDLAIKFANNSAAVPSSAQAEIKRVADFMKEYPTTQVTIEGHTDDRGRASYNKSLSQRRADAVMNELTNRYGIASNRVNAIGYGEEQPIADNNTAAGRSENRRVVAEIKQTIKQ